MENILQANDFGNDFKPVDTFPLSQNVEGASPSEAPEFDPSEPPEPLDNPVLAFLRRVLPESGPYAVRGLKTLIKKDDPEVKAKGAKPSRVICDEYVQTIDEISVLMLISL